MSRHFRIPLLLMIVLFLTETILITLARAGDSGRDRDPLAELALLMPGQGITGLEAYSPVCQQLAPVASLPMRCSIHLLKPPLIQAQVTVQKKVIQAVRVEVDRLFVGDLVRRWGKPDLIVKRFGKWTIAWGNQVFTWAGGEGQFSYLLPIRFISFSLGNQPSDYPSIP